MSSADSIGAAAPLPDPKPVSQDAFSSLIDRATSRLQSDSDLRLEIAQELRGHLQDSAAEYRAAGMSEAEAEAKAVEAMGDPGGAGRPTLAGQPRPDATAGGGDVGVRGAGARRWRIAICFSLVWGVVTSLSLLTVTGVIGGTGTDWRFPVRIGPGPAHRAWARLVERVRPEDRVAIRAEDVGTASRADFRREQAHRRCRGAGRTTRSMPRMTSPSRCCSRASFRARRKSIVRPCET